MIETLKNLETVMEFTITDNHWYGKELVEINIEDALIKKSFIVISYARWCLDNKEELEENGICLGDFNNLVNLNLYGGPPTVSLQRPLDYLSYRIEYLLTDYKKESFEAVCFRQKLYPIFRHKDDNSSNNLPNFISWAAITYKRWRSCTTHTHT